MFVGAQLAHLGERARETCQRSRAALSLGALAGLDVMAADDHLDLRQFALDRAGDALDQRDAGGVWRIAGAVNRGAPAAYLPSVDRGARGLIGRLDRNRLGAHGAFGGGEGLVALLDRSIPLGLQLLFDGPCGFRLCGFLDDAFRRCPFRRRFFSR
jgi:hypothetical protein